MNLWWTGVLVLLLPSLCQPLRRLSWWPVLSFALVQWERLRTSPLQVDFSAGAGSLSSPEKLVHVPQLVSGNRTGAFGEGGDRGSGTAPPLLLAHQLGKKMVKKLPDSALLGVLVLIASELLQREVNTQFLTLPPVLRALANNTALELDTKLEFLSSLQWDVDPFLRAEIENLNKQPLEVIDRFIVTEILPRVDNQLSPVLSNLIGDPNSVSLITRNIKDLIQVISVVITADSQNEKRPATLTDTVMKQVDLVGETVEEAIKDWNRIIFDMGKLVKAESIIDLIPVLGFSNTTLSAANLSSYLWGSAAQQRFVETTAWTEALIDWTVAEVGGHSDAPGQRHAHEQRRLPPAAADDVRGKKTPPLLGWPAQTWRKGNRRKPS